VGFGAVAAAMIELSWRITDWSIPALSTDPDTPSD
jgi:hypothetical protein